MVSVILNCKKNSYCALYIKAKKLIVLVSWVPFLLRTVFFYLHQSRASVSYSNDVLILLKC